MSTLAIYEVRRPVVEEHAAVLHLSGAVVAPVDHGQVVELPGVKTVGTATFS